MTTHMKRWAHLALVLGCSFGAAACDSLLEVELPAQLGDDALEDPAGAESVVITMIEHFEQAVDLMIWQFHGHEDGGEIRLASPGTNNGDMNYSADATGGPRSNVQLGTASGYSGWFQSLTTSIRFARLLHNKLDKEWTVQQVPARTRYLAFSSLYEGAALTRLGESMCDIALDNGPLQGPPEILTLAETTLTRALTEIAALPGGDVALPYGISTSAKNMAYGLRAQTRWMKGDLTGAAADAALVPNNFTAWVTRDANAARNNKAFFAGTENRYAELYDVVDWWLPPNRTNPVTNQPWPAIIPFTGYPYLGILPDGRAVRDNGHPIRRTGAKTGPGLTVDANAVADTRVPFFLGAVGGIGGGVQRPIHQKYANAASDIPTVNWKEMILIRAEAVGGQAAIDLVNVLRTADNLPRVTYITGATATPAQIRYMIIEERRRALFLEGRFLMTKIKNTDILWFPRSQGQTAGSGRALGGGVRFVMPDTEFLYNPNLKGDLNLRATKCAANERPILTAV